MPKELEHFLELWEQETEGTLALLRALPTSQYDFRPDPGGRSIGELAWHLAEVDGYVSLAIERGEFSSEVQPPHITRPKTIEALAPGFRVVHEEAVARIARLQPSDLEREVRFADGKIWTVRNLLWHLILLHSVHHRGQLALQCRLAGGVLPALYGPTREQSRARQAEAVTH